MNNEMSRSDIARRIGQIDGILFNGVSDKEEEERLINERNNLNALLFGEIEDKDDDYLYDDYYDQEEEEDLELKKIDDELDRLRSSFKNNSINDSNDVTQEQMQFLLRRIAELEGKRKKHLEVDIKDYRLESDSKDLSDAKALVDEINKREEELNKYFSNEDEILYDVFISNLKRRILQLKEDLEKLKKNLSDSELAELNNYIDNNKVDKNISLLDDAKKLVDEINKLEDELSKYYSGELEDSFGNRSSEINRNLIELNNKLNLIKGKLNDSEFAELNNYINSKKMVSKNSLLDDAKRLVDEINKLKEELLKYYSGELEDSFGNRSSEINRKLAELGSKLEQIKGRLSDSELAELNSYINDSNKKDDNLVVNENKGNNADKEKSELNKPTIMPLPGGYSKEEDNKDNNESFENNEELGNERNSSRDRTYRPTRRKVVNKKEWVCKHKKILITAGVIALAIGTLVLVTHLGPAIVAGKMTANAFAWHGASAAVQADLHAKNVLLAPQLAKAFGSQFFAENAGIWTFNGVKLGAVAAKASATVAASLAAMGIGAGLLTKGIRSSSEDYNKYKNRYSNMKRYFDDNIINDYELSNKEKIQTIDQLVKDLDDFCYTIEDNNSLSKSEKKNLLKKIDRFLAELNNTKRLFISDNSFENFDDNENEEISEAKFSKISDLEEENRNVENISLNSNDDDPFKEIRDYASHVVQSNKAKPINLNFNSERPEAYNWEEEAELSHGRGR